MHIDRVLRTPRLVEVPPKLEVVLDRDANVKAEMKKIEQGFKDGTIQNTQQGGVKDGPANKTDPLNPF